MNFYDLVIFDFDGTVCATRNAIAHCIKKTFAAFAEDIPHDEIIRDVVSQGIGMMEAFSQLKPPHKNLADFEEWLRVYRQIYSQEALEKTELFSGIKEMFSYISSLQIPIVIISNKGEAAIIAALQHFDLMKNVSLFIGDRPNIKSKPDPMPFEVVIKPHFNHVPSERILMIGDTTADLLFAKNIRSHSCWVSYGYGEREDCLSLQPTVIIDHPLELRSFI